MYNPTWNKTLVSAVLTHFKTALLPHVPLVTHGEPHSHKSYVELRFFGPLVQEFTKDQFRLHLTVNALIVTEQNPKNVFTPLVAEGHVCAAFTGFEIPSMGCVMLDGEIVTRHYGIVNNFFKTTVEGTYYIDL